MVRGFAAVASVAMLLGGTAPSHAAEKIQCNHKIGDVVDFGGSISQRGPGATSLADVRLASCPDTRFEIAVSTIPQTCANGSKISGKGTIDTGKDPAKPAKPDNWMSAWVGKTFGSDYYRINAKKVSCE